MKRSRALLAGAFVASAAGFMATGPAQAGPIIAGTSETFNVTSEVASPGVPYGFMGSVTYSTVTSSTLGFNFSILNTSTNNPLVNNDNRLTSFGFDISGTTVNIVNVTDSGPSSGSWTAVVEGSGPGTNFPSFTVDVCVYAGNNCAGAGGGGSPGLNPGETLNLVVTLNGTFIPPLNFNFIAGQFQSLGTNQQGSNQIAVAPTPVPAPGALALLGTGLLGLGLTARWRPSRRSKTDLQPA